MKFTGENLTWFSQCWENTLRLHFHYMKTIMHLLLLGVDIPDMKPLVSKPSFVHIIHIIPKKLTDVMAGNGHPSCIVHAVNGMGGIHFRP